VAMLLASTTMQVGKVNLYIFKMGSSLNLTLRVLNALSHSLVQIKGSPFLVKSVNGLAISAISLQNHQ
jgi:hypothetical protein